MGDYYNKFLPVWAPSGDGFDPDAQNFIDTALITDADEQEYYNTLVLALKVDMDIWNNIVYWHPTAGTAAQALFNLKDPDTFKLISSGGIVVDALGSTFNGTTGYYATQCVLSDNIDNADDMTIYVAYNEDKNVSKLNGVIGTNNSRALIGVEVGTNLYLQPNTTSIKQIPTSDSLGLKGYSRSSATDGKAYDRGSITSFTDVSPVLPNDHDFYYGCRNNKGSASLFIDRRFIGGILLNIAVSDTQAGIIQTAFDNFNNSFGRKTW